MSSIAGENVVVVGGTSGIGLAVAKLAAQAGARVLALGRSRENIDRAMQSGSDGVQFAIADIHDSAALTAQFEAVGKVHHLVGSATGAQRTIAPFMQQTHEQFSAAFGKLWGYAGLLRAVAPFLETNASITLVSGTPARRCGPGQVSLSCTGAAVEALCRQLAVELAPVRVNAVAPGIIDTGMYDWMGQDREATLGKMTADLPLPRPGSAQETAEAVMYLIRSDYVTGTVMDVDGGLLLVR